MNDPSIQLLEKFKALQRRLDDLNTLGTPLIPWTDYSAISTIVGWTSFTTKVINYKRDGKMLFCEYHLAGTSNSATTTFTLPHLNQTTMNVPCLAVDSGTIVANPICYAGNPTVQFYKDITGAVWTATGAKQVRGQFFFEIYLA